MIYVVVHSIISSVCKLPEQFVVFAVQNWHYWQMIQKAIITTSTAGGGAGDATADKHGGVVVNDYNNDLECVKQSSSAEQMEGQ